MLKVYQTEDELIRDLNGMTVASLRKVATEFDVIPRNLKRDVLIERILGHYKGELEPEERKKPGRPRKEKGQTVMQQGVKLEDEDDQPESNNSGAPRQLDSEEGVLEVLDEGYGFVRSHNYSFSQNGDYFITANLITRMRLSTGDKLRVALRQYPDRQAPTVVYVEEINDESCSSIKRTPFDKLEPCFPNERLNLHTDKTDYSLRMLDLVAPIGKGQRGLIVAPPKTGKTILLKKLAMAIRKNHPDIHLTVLLIDERPEEVTDFKESLDCDVVYSTFDQQASNHCRVAELVFANARRRVEQGQDVMILLDSITRLARAYNQIAEQSGRTLTGGLDAAALQEPKKMFGAGRNIRNGGSLTILATALVDTGSKMDDIIYEEFKSTGNMEIQLDRRMSEKRIFPAVDLNRSGTRREELLLNQNQLEGMYLVRRMLGREDSAQATEELLEVIMSTDNNDEAIATLKRIITSVDLRRSLKK